MKQRIITAIVIGIIAIPICIFSWTPVFPIVMAFLGVVGVYELLGCMGTRKDLAFSIPLYIMAAVIPLAVWYLEDGTVGTFKLEIVHILLIYALYLLAIWIFRYEKHPERDMNVYISSTLVCLYIIGAFSSVVMVRSAQGGEYYWYFIFIGAWVTDIFAYFSGRLFGKHKLMPNTSPKKTVEGSIGGMIFCVGAFIGYGALINHFTDADISLALVALMGLLCSVVSQIGDLSMSVIKRTYGIKDYGKLFPGHGGVLDRFDSILAVAVVLAFFLA